MKALVTFLVLCFVSLGFSQVSLTSGNLISIDFDSYDGSGFAPSPAAGQLDSDNWASTGMSDGDLGFGGTGTSGDFARGASSGNETTGGFYAFEVMGGDFALGMQPGGSDFTPGTVTLRLQNNTGSVLSQLNIQYDVYSLNDQNRANSLNFSYSVDDISYAPVGALDYTSVEAADIVPGWTSETRTTSITGLSVANGDFVYVRWEGDDVSGSGSRDEFAINDILISEGDTPLPVELSLFAASAGDAKVMLKWTTASEIDNQGFAIMRSLDKEADYEEIDSYVRNDKLRGAGTSSQENSYSYEDRYLTNGVTYWYKLVDVDANGVRTEHGPVYATPHVESVKEIGNALPQKFELAQNEPNPFNPSTTIRFDVPALKDGALNVVLSVFNSRGQKVATLFEGAIDAGSYQSTWNGRDDAGSLVPSGVYIYQLQSASFTESKRMLLIK